MAFGLSGFAGGRLVEGAPYILKILAWKKAARQADIILTGEGKVDLTSFGGKVLGTVLENKSRAKVLVVCGSTPLSSDFLRKKGVSRLTQMGPGGLKHPKQELRKATLKLLENHQREFSGE